MIEIEKNNTSLLDFDSSRLFWQIGFRSDADLILTIEGNSSETFYLGMNEYMFYIFMGAFYDTREEYEYSNTGQHVVSNDYVLISKKLKDIEKILLEKDLNFNLVNKNLSNFQFSEFEITRYLEVISKNKILFQIAILQLEEWIERNMKDKLNSKVIIYGY